MLTESECTFLTVLLNQKRILLKLEKYLQTNTLHSGIAIIFQIDLRIRYTYNSTHYKINRIKPLIATSEYHTLRSDINSNINDESTKYTSLYGQATVFTCVQPHIYFRSFLTWTKPQSYRWGTKKRIKKTTVFTKLQPINL